MGRQMYPSQAYRTHDTAAITKGHTKVLTTLREVTAKHGRQVVHAVNLKLARKGDCLMLNPSPWEA